MELVTPPLDSGTVLPGVTRQSVLDLAREIPGVDVIQRRITLPEVRRNIYYDKSRFIS